MLKPNGNRCVLQLTKKYLVENKKPVIDESGNPSFITEQGAKVLASNVEGIKKGATVYPIIRGGVPIYHLENKKYQVIVVDAEDIYGIEA